MALTNAAKEAAALAISAGQVVTFPNSGYATLIVQKDLG